MNLCYAGLLSYWDQIHLLHRCVKKQRDPWPSSQLQDMDLWQRIKNTWGGQCHQISFSITGEGSCWVEHIKDFAYDCLTALFVDSQHLEGLKEKEIEVLQGGFIGETNVRSKNQEIKKFFWGHNELPHKWSIGCFILQSRWRCYSLCVFLLEYGSNKPALISHLWCGNDLVFGNEENIALTTRDVLGNQIF